MLGSVRIGKCFKTRSLNIWLLNNNCLKVGVYQINIILFHDVCLLDLSILQLGS